MNKKHFNIKYIFAKKLNNFMKPGIFSTKSYSIKTVFFVLFIVAGFCLTVLFTALVLFLSNPGVVLSGQMPELNAQMLRILQTIQSFFVFIIPALLFVWFFCNHPTEYLYLER